MDPLQADAHGHKFSNAFLLTGVSGHNAFQFEIQTHKPYAMRIHFKQMLMERLFETLFLRTGISGHVVFQSEIQPR